MIRNAFLILLVMSPGVAFSAGTSTLDPQIETVLNNIQPSQIKAYDDKLVSFGTRSTLSDTTSDSRGIGAARRWIEAEMNKCAAKSNGRMTVSLDEHIEPVGRRVPQPTNIVNVVATLKGSAASERVIVVSGHYDSRATDVMDASSDAPGANDDASGSAAVIAMACAFAPYSWPATLVFMNVAGEEQGLLGAEHWAQNAASQHRNIIGMIDNDIIGSPVGDQGQRDDMQVRLFADGFSPLLKLVLDGQTGASTATQIRSFEESKKMIDTMVRSGGMDDTPTHELGRYLKDAAETYLPGFHVNLINRRDRYLRGGDHLPFLDRGYAAVRFTEPFENFAHQHQNVRVENGVQFGDLSEFVDFTYVARIAQVNAAGMGSLAQAPIAPVGVGMQVSELSNDTSLIWTATQDDSVSGYRIVWRATGASTWQYAKDVGKVNQTTLKGISKDNYVFGVASVGPSGAASLPVFPQPVK
jgi:hypothetical protein